MTRFSALDPTPYLPDPDLAARLLTPALAVHLDRVRSNVRRILELLGGDANRWRPHVKTTKLPPVWRLLAAEGIRHFKCATTRELDVLLATLSAAGVEDADVLVAYPHRQPALGRLAEIAERHPEARVSVLVEDATLCDDVPEPLSLFVDVNSGMDRTGIPAEDLEEIRRVQRAAGPRYRGLHWYDGHLHEADVDARAAAIERGLERVADTILALDAATPELITAGTPAFLGSRDSKALARCPDTVHRVSPGTVVFHDLRSELENEALGLTPAAVVLTRVISHPAPDLATCDAGSKSIAAEAGTPICAVIGHPELTARAPSEEHLPFRVDPARRPARGTLLALVPMHVCPTVNLAEETLLFDRGQFVSAAAIEARAHELLVGPR